MRFGIRPDGNAPEDPQGEFTGKNLLYVASSIEEVAARPGKSRDEVEASLQRARMTLFKARLARPRPLPRRQSADRLERPDARRVRASGAACCRGEARERATSKRPSAPRGSSRRACGTRRDRCLKRRYREGDAAIDGYAEDYAYLIFGLLELFQASGDPHWLEWALTLQKRQDELFWDAENGGWFNTTGDDPSVILRMKEDYDGAEPAPSSISVLNLLMLAHLTGEASSSSASKRR